MASGNGAFARDEAQNWAKHSRLSCEAQDGDARPRCHLLDHLHFRNGEGDVPPSPKIREVKEKGCQHDFSKCGGGGGFALDAFVTSPDRNLKSDPRNPRCSCFLSDLKKDPPEENTTYEARAWRHAVKLLEQMPATLPGSSMSALFDVDGLRSFGVPFY